MYFTKTLQRLFLFTIVLAVSYKNPAKAQGGFPVRPGRLIVTPSVSYFFSNSQWDSTGVKRSFVNDGKYSAVGVNLFAEYGIDRRFAVVATLPYVMSSYTQAGGPNTKVSGLTDLETGIKYYLANIDFIYYISLQGTAITPLYTNHQLGYDQEGAEMKIAFSGTGHLFGRGTYFNAEDGVRQYFGTNGPIQNRYNGSFGITLDDDFMNQVSVSLSGIYSISDNKGFSPILGTNKDYSFLQGTVSYGHSFTHELSLFASGGRFLAGRNTGIGTIFSLALIYRLDYR